MPLELFNKYFLYIFFGVDKVIGLVGTMNDPTNLYTMDLDIQDLHYNIRHDYVTHKINFIHNEIKAAHRGEIGNFKLHHYLLLIHIILYKNIGPISLDFIEGKEENGEKLPVQLWTKVWKRLYPCSNVVAFYNNYFSNFKNVS